jgi:hypothetical protein
MLLLASLLLKTFILLMAPCMKSLFWLVSMLFLAHHVAAGIPAVADDLYAVGSLHGVPVFACVHAVSGHHVPAGIPAFSDVHVVVGSLHEVPVSACVLPCCFWRTLLLLASLLLATFLMLLAPCMKSLFLLVSMLFLAHHEAAWHSCFC